MNWHTEKGQNLVIVALSMVALVAMLALVTDGSLYLAHRRQMQNAADAAALAGLRELALGHDGNAVSARIQEYAMTHNGAGQVTARYLPSQVEVAGGGIPEGTTGIAVTAMITFPTFFAQMLGFSQMAVEASSAGQWGSTRRARALWPVAVAVNDFQYGTEYNLVEGKTGAGGFGWLDWNGPPVSPQELADDLRYPTRSGEWHIGDWVWSSPGAKETPELVYQALDAWLVLPYAARHVTVPVYDVTQGIGTDLQYHIVGFAEFTITGYDFRVPPAERKLLGVFTRWVEPTGDIVAGPYYGVAGLRLTP